MSTINMPPKKEADEETPNRRQERPVLNRYRLFVDRQLKSSFKDKSAAETAGQKIKKAFPVVQVVVYDAETEDRSTVT